MAVSVEHLKPYRSGYSNSCVKQLLKARFRQAPSSASLILVPANVGARVIQMSSDHLLDIFRVREALEGMAARLAAAKMTPEQVQTLMETLDEHGETINEDAGNNYFQESGDLDFHYQVVMGSCSDHLIKLLCNDLYYLVRLYRCQFGMRSKRGPIAIVEHRNIAEAIARGDGEMAELLMRSHIRASRENVERLLTQQN